MISSINHYTLNTGGMRTTTPDEVSAVIYFRFKNVINKAKVTEYVDVVDNIKMHLTIEQSAYACTLFAGEEDNLVPIVYTCGCSNKDDISLIWPITSEMYKQVYGDQVKIVPMFPFIADIVLPGAVTRIDALQWTGDFCRCLGWMLLEPNAIVEV